MMRSLLAAALLLSPMLAEAQTKPKSKPVPAKAAPAKPAPKPGPAPAPAPEKPAPKPRVPASLDRADKGAFGVLQVAAPDSAKFMAAWKLGAASQAATKSTVANQPLFTFLIFHGCKANGVGLCDVVADFVIHRPDGTINDENKGIVVWNKAAPVDAKRAYLGDGALGYGVDDDGPFGDYRVVATVTDRVADVSVTTEQTLTFAPMILPK